MVPSITRKTAAAIRQYFAVLVAVVTATVVFVDSAACAEAVKKRRSWKWRKPRFTEEETAKKNAKIREAVKVWLEKKKQPEEALKNDQTEGENKAVEDRDQEIKEMKKQ